VPSSTSPPSAGQWSAPNIRSAAFSPSPELAQASWSLATWSFTCQHVIDDITPAGLTLEFDYKVRGPGQPPTPGPKYAVQSILEASPPSAADSQAPPKAVEASSQELDYAFLLVDGAPGDETVDGTTAREFKPNRSMMETVQVSETEVAELAGATRPRPPAAPAANRDPEADGGTKILLPMIYDSEK
jgi:hypothetical protein